MTWYDLFSRFYDLATERVYHPIRHEAFAELEPDGITAVLDLACGTGQNFPHLIERLGEDAHVIGVDYSTGMLDKARRRVTRNGWRNVTLLETDARTLSQQQIDDAVGRPTEIDCVVATLALQALPEWERVLAACFELLRPGGQFLELGVWAERRVPQTWWTEAIARADLDRQTWEPLERLAERTTIQFLEGSPHIHGGRLYVASGFKSS